MQATPEFLRVRSQSALERRLTSAESESGGSTHRFRNPIPDRADYIHILDNRSIDTDTERQGGNDDDAK